MRRGSPARKKERPEKPMTTTIETTIRPYSYRREEIQVGQFVDGEFVQDRKFFNVLKDSRLIIVH